MVSEMSSSGMERGEAMGGRSSSGRSHRNIMRGAYLLLVAMRAHPGGTVASSP
jgi:hypothetical protein